jgi:hypothetical protein
MKSLEAQLDAWTAKTLARTEAVIKTAVQDMTTEMQTPRSKGGRLPVDTGFLRNSILGNGVAPVIGLTRWNIESEPYTLGWTANYAIYMDARYGFFRLGIQNWPQHVQRAITKVKR